MPPAVDDPITAIRTAETLADLVAITGTDSEHAAYFAAKQLWADHRADTLDSTPPTDSLPGDCVTIDGHRFCVHGITHADTAAEGDYLRDHVSRLLENGATVYCEQGIRPMYFRELPAVCAMDDYRWAMQRCQALDVESHLSDVPSEFAGVTEEFDTLRAQAQDAVFSLIESGRDVYGDQFETALGDVASSLFTSHENAATGDDFESFQLTRRAAQDPSALIELQNYYKRTFLPQPLEREWLRRHDPELELLTHARNERMADYAVYHNEDATEVHLIVGAAHQPGVTYYFEQYRDGSRTNTGFEPVA
ncbi:MAG: hypothetical protein SVG88_15045 [Halobacteriales archaeon]|nr:hypothetical protein [Halobacteriales archaeon]